MKLNKYLILSFVMIMLSSMSAKANVRCEVGYLYDGFKIFDISDLINEEMMDQGVTIDAIENFFYVEINGDDADMDTPIYIEVEETIGGESVIRFVSSQDDPFTVGQWINNSPGHDGKYENQQFAQLQDAEWFKTDWDRTSYADYDRLSNMISDGALVQTTFTIRFTVRNANTGTAYPSFSRTITVYNPSEPTLTEPENESTVDNPPMLRWDWPGNQFHTNPQTDWVLYVVEGNEGDDGLSVIGDPPNPNPNNVRYEGPPTTAYSHQYTNFYPHQELTPGNWYFWAVQVTVPTASGGTKVFNSNVFSFQYGEQQQEEGGGQFGGGFGGGNEGGHGGQGGDGGEGGLGGGQGGQGGDGGQGGFGDEQGGQGGHGGQGGGDDEGYGRGQGGQGGQGGNQGGQGNEGNQGNRNRGRGEWEYNQDSEAVFNVLDSKLSNDQVVSLRRYFREYQLSNIIIDQEGQKTATDLATFLNISGFTVKSISME